MKETKMFLSYTGGGGVNKRYTIEQFGGKANDKTADNSIALKLAYETLGVHGGIIEFRAAKYYFSTPVVLDNSGNYGNYYQSIIIEGTGVGDKLTDLVYTGEGYFFTNEYCLWACGFRNFRITLTVTNYGLNFKGLLYRSEFKNVSFYNGLGKVKVGKAAYVHFEDCMFNTPNESPIRTTEYDLMIGGDDKTCEFVYFDRCVFGGEGSGDSVIIQNSNNIYFDKCDICYHKSSTGMYIHAVNKYIFAEIIISNTNFINCYKSIVVDAEKQHILNSQIDNCLIIVTGESADEKVIQYVNRSDSESKDNYSSSFDIRSLSLRSIGSTLPDFFFECTNKNKGNTRIDFKHNDSQIKLYDTGDSWSYVPCNFNWIKWNKQKTITTNGTTKVYYIDIVDVSPFRDPPCFVLQYMSSTITIPQYSYNIVNTFKGQLRLQIVFAEAPEEGTIKFVYFANPYMHQCGVN